MNTFFQDQQGQNDLTQEAVYLKYPNLKKQAKAGFVTEFWAKESLADGLSKYFDEHGRYPTAEEVDAYEFLPSARQIQRAFGGLKNLRKQLGLPTTDFGSGENRSKIAHFINKRSFQGEKDLEKILVEYFGEHFVHIEKPLYNYFAEGTKFKNKLRGDFFVYCKEGSFVVDVFFAKNRNSIRNNLNLI